jgi:ferredoxin-nitrite reductase
MAAFYPIFLNLESRRCLVVGGGMEAERYGRGEIRLTSGQNLIIPYVPDPFLEDLAAEPLFQGLRYDPSPIMRGLVSCTGIEFCNLAVIETKHRALTIARALAHTVTPTKSVTIA